MEHEPEVPIHQIAGHDDADTVDKVHALSSADISQRETSLSYSETVKEEIFRASLLKIVRHHDALALRKASRMVRGCNLPAPICRCAWHLRHSRHDWHDWHDRHSHSREQSVSWQSMVVYRSLLHSTQAGMWTSTPPAIVLVLASCWRSCCIITFPAHAGFLVGVKPAYLRK